MKFRGIDHGIIKRFTYTRNDEPLARYKMRHDPFRIAASIRNPSIKASIQTAYGILEYCRTSYGNSRARKSIRSTERFVTEVGRGTRIHPTAYVVPKGVRIGGECRIGPRAVVMGGSFIDDQVTIGPLHCWVRRIHLQEMPDQSHSRGPRWRSPNPKEGTNWRKLLHR